MQYLFSWVAELRSYQKHKEKKIKKKEETKNKEI